ncbi:MULTISPECIES: thioredoxin family protein [unclassified Pseudofrankia]|uniref:thioredoxin family protein n=1 Tax=unclassified Pseudofrankia TaxID=2994372 RepID=UPI0009F673D9|nr:MULTISPECIES: thioredoxin family protein [unclassified Pseudofrankia]MDT3438682.1 thioredoxin family protein [Pseudofrankia sp. BMG5.37]
MTGLWALVAAVVVATAIGVTLRRRDGRFRPARGARNGRPTTALGGAEYQDVASDPAGSPAEDPTAEDPPVTAATMTLAEPPVAPPTESLAGELTSLGREAGERATLLQFSTAFCAPCRTTRTVLADVARIVPGVAHVEVDAEDNLELVRQLGIRRTPTVLVLDGHAREISRASGAPPSRAAVIAALGPVATESEPMEP